MHDPRLGPIIALSHRCPGVIAFSRGCDLAVVEEVDFNAQQYRRTDRRAIPADKKKTRVYLDSRVGGRFVIWEGRYGGKGEHGSKGGRGSKGRQQVENSVVDEGQGNTRAMGVRKKRRTTGRM